MRRAAQASEPGRVAPRAVVPAAGRHPRGTERGVASAEPNRRPCGPDADGAPGVRVPRRARGGIGAGTGRLCVACRRCRSARASRRPAAMRRPGLAPFGAAGPRTGRPPRRVQRARAPKVTRAHRDGGPVSPRGPLGRSRWRFGGGEFGFEPEVLVDDFSSCASSSMVGRSSSRSPAHAAAAATSARRSTGRPVGGVRNRGRHCRAGRGTSGRHR